MITTGMAIVRRCGMYYFNGSGIKIIGGGEFVGENWAANGTIVEDCKIYQNSGSGIYAEGSDANAGYFARNDIYGSGRIGIRDRSHLGNTNDVNVFHANGTENPFNRSYVYYAPHDKRYISIQENNVNHTPPNLAVGENDGWWYVFGTGALGLGVHNFNWNAGTTYYIGGAIQFGYDNSIGPNQSVVHRGDYIEPDQFAGWNYGSNLLLGDFYKRILGPGVIATQAGFVSMKSGLTIDNESKLTGTVLHLGNTSEETLKYLTGALRVGGANDGGGNARTQFFKPGLHSKVEVWNGAGDNNFSILMNGSTAVIGNQLSGNMEVGTTGSTTTLKGTPIMTLPTHADEAAAVTAGLATGTIYKTSTGELRIKL
jgi:hypothetical protein